MSYDSSNLTTPDIKWLGVRPSDLDRFNIPAQCRLPMTEEDLKTGRKLLEEDFVKANPDWVRELEIMVRNANRSPPMPLRGTQRPRCAHGGVARAPPSPPFPLGLGAGVDQSQGGDPGAEQLWLPVPLARVPSAQAPRRRLDLI